MKIHQNFKAYGITDDDFDPEDFIYCETEQELREELSDRLTCVQSLYPDFTLDVDRIEIDEDDMEAFIEEWKEVKGL
jgi:hypothetical protein